MLLFLLQGFRFLPTCSATRLRTLLSSRTSLLTQKQEFKFRRSRHETPRRGNLTNGLSEDPYNCRETRFIQNSAYAHHHCMHQSFKGKAINLAR